MIGQQQHYLEAIKNTLWSKSVAAVPPVVSAGEVTPTQTTTITESTETTDLTTGVTTVTEVTTTVETSPTTAFSDTSLSDTEASPTAVTQGDVLNAKKAMRDKARPERCQTRSMGRNAVVDLPAKRKIVKKKKLKTQ